MIKHILFLNSLLIFVFNSFSQDSVKVNVKLAARTPVKGTTVSIQPPEKFVFSDKIKGFVHAGSASSIAITEADGISWIQMCQSFSQENLNGQGVNLISQEDVTLHNGVTGRFFTMRMIIKSNDSTKQDLEFERLMLFAGDYHHTVWINANYPAMLKPVIYETLRESMLSVEINNSSTVPNE